MLILHSIQHAFWNGFAYGKSIKTFNQFFSICQLQHVGELNCNRSYLNICSILRDDTVFLPVSARIYPLVIYVNFQKSSNYHYHHTSYLYAIWFWNLLPRYCSRWVKWICLWRFIARYLSTIQVFLTAYYKLK